MLNILNCFLGCHLHRNNRNIVHLSNIHLVPIFLHTSPVRVIHFTAPLGNNRLKKCSNVIHRVSNRTPPDRPSKRMHLIFSIYNFFHCKLYLNVPTIITHTTVKMVWAVHTKRRTSSSSSSWKGASQAKKQSNHPHADILQTWVYSFMFNLNTTCFDQ